MSTTITQGSIDAVISKLSISWWLSFVRFSLQSVTATQQLQVVELQYMYNVGWLSSTVMIHTDTNRVHTEQWSEWTYLHSLVPSSWIKWGDGRPVAGPAVTVVALLVYSDELNRTKYTHCKHIPQIGNSRLANFSDYKFSSILIFVKVGLNHWKHLLWIKFRFVLFSYARACTKINWGQNILIYDSTCTCNFEVISVILRTVH